MTLASRLLSLPVLVYRYGISPLMPAACRYQPTCSEYALDALAAHGALKGSVLALRRILRCHPWGGHGFDPVPAALSKTAVKGEALPGSTSDNSRPGHCGCKV